MAEPSKPSWMRVSAFGTAATASTRNTALQSHAWPESRRSALLTSVRWYGRTLGATAATASNTAITAPTGATRDRRRTAIRTPAPAMISPASMIVAGGPIEPRSQTTTAQAHPARDRNKNPARADAEQRQPDDEKRVVVEELERDDPRVADFEQKAREADQEDLDVVTAARRVG